MCKLYNRRCGKFLIFENVKSIIQVQDDVLFFHKFINIATKNLWLNAYEKKKINCKPETDGNPINILVIYLSPHLFLYLHDKGN